MDPHAYNQEDHDPNAEYFDLNDVQEEYIPDETQHDLIDDDDDDNYDAEMDTEELQETMEEIDAANHSFSDDSLGGFFTHSDPVYAVAVHPNLPFVLTGGGDDKAFVYRYDSGEQVYAFTDHTDSVVSVAISYDGKYAVTGGMDGKIFAYDFETGAKVTEMETGGEVTFIQFHPRGNVIIAGSTDASLWMYGLPNGQVMQVFSGGHSDTVTCGTFTPDGKFIITGGEDGSLCYWDPKTAACIHKFTSTDQRWHQSAVTSVAVHTDGKACVSGDAEGCVRMVSLKSNTLVANLDLHTESIEKVLFNESLNVVITCSVDTNIGVWDLSSGRLRGSVRHEDAVTCLALVPGTPFFVTSGADKTVRIWDVRSLEIKRCLRGHTETVLALEVSRDGKYVVTGSDDFTSLVFSLQ